MPNALIHETSPYLLQHAHNPVQWYAWGQEPLQKALAQNKPILVSIGYSACHWCHVMERESFENEAVAEYMNQHFINIKIDREERPDLDQIFMDAVTTLNKGNGGWPLNCFLLPTGEPFYGGTYYPPVPAYNRPDWLSVLQAIQHAFVHKPHELKQQAQRLLYHLTQTDKQFVQSFVITNENNEVYFEQNTTNQCFEQLKKRFDTQSGGFGTAPKFPSTQCLEFLFQHHFYTQNTQALEHAHFSLQKMIQGGIYDHLQGGFARYATDNEWIIPHFEKMLYDNALIVSVLCTAYKVSKKILYKQVIDKTLQFIETELTDPADYGFFTALDADSEGVEGKYYTWQKNEIGDLLQQHAPIFNDYYNILPNGNWEHQQNILHQTPEIDIQFLAKKYEKTTAEIEQILQNATQKLLEHRQKRIKPLLDDKKILANNALMCQSFAKAYQTFQNPQYLHIAQKNMDFMLQKYSTQNPDNELKMHHTFKNGKATQPAFLDDYAFLIAALLQLHKATFNLFYLNKAQQYTQYVIQNFAHTPPSPLFFYTHQYQTDLLLRKTDLYDNATPSGNSTMAHNLHQLGNLLHIPQYQTQAQAMLKTLENSLTNYPNAFANWVILLQQITHGTQEVAILGTNATQWASEINQHYLPNTLIMATNTPNEHYNAFINRYQPNNTLLYICKNQNCLAPINTLNTFWENNLPVA